MSTNKAPPTQVQEVMIASKDTLHLSVQDSLQDVMRKGLYNAPNDKPVMIFDGSEVIAITAVKKLREEILPRSWSGPLGSKLGRLPLPPEVTSRTRVAALAFLSQQEANVDWLLVIDDETQAPVGILKRTRVLDFIPPPDPIAETHRHTYTISLWGDPDIEQVFYYCQVEDRYYGPHAVHPDAQGKMRDRREHLVEKREPSEG